MQPFSVLMSVYKNDNPADFKLAVESISINQTRKPDEIIIVVDGPIPEELKFELTKLTERISQIRTIFLKINKGLGNALRVGTEAASNEIVARMDSDDISMPDRFEREIGYLENNSDCAMVGGQISEFIGAPENVIGKREVPCDNKEIHEWMKKRCPFNHMTVAFRRSMVFKVGNYIDWHFNEDYYLWIRMSEKGYVLSNLPEVLVNVRVGEQMYARRGGWKYFKSEKGLQDYMLKKGLIGYGRYIFNVGVRFGVQVMMPNSLRAFIFKKLFRKN